jgi:hypothetical protein
MKWRALAPGQFPTHRPEHTRWKCPHCVRVKASGQGNRRLVCWMRGAGLALQGSLQLA